MYTLPFYSIKKILSPGIWSPVISWWQHLLTFSYRACRVSVDKADSEVSISTRARNKRKQYTYLIAYTTNLFTSRNLHSTSQLQFLYNIVIQSMIHLLHMGSQLL